VRLVGPDLFLVVALVVPWHAAPCFLRGIAGTLHCAVSEVSRAWVIPPLASGVSTTLLFPGPAPTSLIDPFPRGVSGMPQYAMSAVCMKYLFLALLRAFQLSRSSLAAMNEGQNDTCWVELETCFKSTLYKRLQLPLYVVWACCMCACEAYRYIG
jgi:hypothetical protein